MISIQDVVYARYQVVDLGRAAEFMQHFGLLPSARTDKALYLRGYGENHHAYVAELGSENRSIGFALAAKSAEDLDRFAKEAGAPVELINEPGGGRRVVVTDPSGYKIEIVHGVERLAPVPMPRVQAVNFGGQRQRVNDLVRPAPGPSHVMRLAHVALHVKDIRASIAFYESRFGMKISDTYFIGDDKDKVVAAFLHCGLGAEVTDHHTVAMVELPKPGFDHISFEVLNWDDVMVGHHHLHELGKYKHTWGVGRHVDGSNVFDYWRDPFGNKVEHYTDGDSVNEHYPSSHSRFNPADPKTQLSVWGPPLGEDFMA
jgi:catechol 2,3-dioxygenase-like lactoylglutathione lyase family enzyme